MGESAEAVSEVFGFIGKEMIAEPTDAPSPAVAHRLHAGRHWRGRERPSVPHTAMSRGLWWLPLLELRSYHDTKSQPAAAANAGSTARFHSSVIGPAWLRWALLPNRIKPR